MHTFVPASAILPLLLILPYTQAAIGPGTGTGSCPPFSCNPHLRDKTRFPFRVPYNQSTRCGYRGFELSCNGDVTLLNLPSNLSKPFVVRGIDYANQLVLLSDPDGCVPNRVLDLNLTGSPYSSGPVTTRYSFLNCSKPISDPESLPRGTSVISCLSGADFTVVSTFESVAKEEMEIGWKCKVIKEVVAVLWWPKLEYGFYPVDMSNAFLQLSWDVPGCGDCELRGGSCGFVDDSGLAVGCFLSGSNGGAYLTLLIN